jgi:ABC-type antimicrobial peptide transport system permease subunit
LFGPADPIGKCVVLGRPPAPCSYVVGVTADARAHEIFEGRPNKQIFLPLSQNRGYYRPNYLILNVDPRHAGEIEARASAELRNLLPDAEGFRFRRTAVQIAPQYRPWKVGAQIFGAFGILSLVVAAIGVYAVVSFSVSQRTHEMGVRIALGAKTRDVINLVAGDGIRVMAGGLAVGLVLALALGGLVKTHLFGVTTHDPYVILGAVCVLAAAGLVASIGPAWRAARVDPIRSLRTD